MPGEAGREVPNLSLVVPTTGGEASVRRVLGCIAGHAPKRMLQGTELIVFLNAPPDSPRDFSGIYAYVDSIAASFLSARVVRTGRYYISAEESALNGVRHATGTLLWIVGDKRIFTPEGILAIDAFVHDRPTPCAYFNSVWYTSKAFTNAHASTHMAAAQAVVPYKQWVMREGFNFMATSMGAWIYERALIDLDLWEHVIRTCGAHFSHVTTMLHGIRESDVTCHAIFAIQAEAKVYHDGDASEWQRYADLADTCLYYPWNFGMVRQFKLLIDRGVYTYDDFRRSMCSEAYVLRRQLDEIYNHTYAQLRLGKSNPKERVSAGDFAELMDFLSLACPEKVILNQMLRDVHASLETDTVQAFLDKMDHIGDACSLDAKQLKFSSLIVGQVGACFVRLHPSGYLVSKISDNTHFMLAYKLLDPPATCRHWTIVDGSVLALAERSVPQPLSMAELFPPDVERRGPSEPPSVHRPTARRLVRLLYRNQWIAGRLTTLPPGVKSYLKKKLL